MGNWQEIVKAMELAVAVLVKNVEEDVAYAWRRE